MSSLSKALFAFVVLGSIGFGQDQPVATVDSSSQKSGGRALLYSLVPGGGQLYNNRPIKAILFSGAFVYYYVGYLSAQKDYAADPTDNGLHRTRNDKVWVMGLIWTLNLIDAYVDAQLWDFDKYDIEMQDLPEQEIIKPKETEHPNDDE